MIAATNLISENVHALCKRDALSKSQTDSPSSSNSATSHAINGMYTQPKEISTSHIDGCHRHTRFQQGKHTAQQTASSSSRIQERATYSVLFAKWYKVANSEIEQETIGQSVKVFGEQGRSSVFFINFSSVRSDKHDLQLRHYFHLKHISLSPVLEFTSSDVVLETTSSLSTSLARTTKDFQIDVWNLPPSRASHLPMNKKATNENLVRRPPPFCFQNFPKIWSPECSPLFSSLLFHSPPPFFLVHNNLNLPFQTDFLKPQAATG